MAEPARTVLRLKCPACQSWLRVPAAWEGSPCQCPHCGGQFCVPDRPSDEPTVPQQPSNSAGPPVRDDARSSSIPTIPVICPVCETRMHARHDQVGESLTCPDCGTATIVPPPARHERPASPVVDDGPELELSDPIERPEVFVPGLAADATGGPNRAARSGHTAKTKIPRADRSALTERPAALEKSSAWALVSGIFLFPLSRYAWARWLTLSLGLAVVLGLLAEAVALGSGALSQFSALGVAYTALFGVIALMWTLAVAAHAVRIVESTAYGREEIDWPDAVWLAWLGESLYVITSLMYAAVSSIAAAWLLTLTGHSNPIASGAVGFFLFPIILLSMLEVGSPMIPVSAAVLARLLRVWWAWAIVYAQRSLILGAAGAAAWAAYRVGGAHALIPIAPLAVGAIWIDARLLGRLAWYLAARDQAAAVAEKWQIRHDS